MLRQGYSPEQVAEQRGLTRQTIVGHMERLILDGRIHDLDRYIEPARRREIEALFRKVRTNGLGPVVAASGNTVGYDEARLVQAFLRRPRTS